MRTKINVTAADIKCGTRMHGSKCPVARAVFRSVKVPSDQYVCVICPELSFRKHLTGEVVSRHKLPLKATKFVRAFDCGELVKPFSFVLK